MTYLASSPTGLYPFHLVAEHQRAEEGGAVVEIKNRHQGRESSKGPAQRFPASAASGWENVASRKPQRALVRPARRL